MGTDTNTQNQIPESPLAPSLIPVEQGSEIDPIRTETIFSRMPLHVLSKSGPRPQINIEKRSSNGRVEEKWEVTYNEKYGPARQLAYDVHTLVIERAIEEAFEEARRTGQPFPRMIPLSSLNDVANRLGPQVQTRDTNRIKKALSQNAGILITALKRYRGNDGGEYTIEGVFTPYGIFFFGQKLPDGRRADQVYVSLNEAYFEAWSRAATRPLDYNYKAQLPPIPRRFYELVSYAIYGAIKNGHTTARYRYSEFCKNAPQLRYETFDQVKKQMYKIHRPHLDEQYIVKVKYEQTDDEQGRADWWMIYTPGPRAYAEFAVFTGKKPRLAPAAAGGESKPRRPRQRSLSLEPEVDTRQLAALTSRGVSEPASRKLLAELPAGFPVLDTLEWGDFQIASQGSRIQNPPGFYISLLRDRITPPPTFETSQQKTARLEAEKAQEQARLRQQENEHAYDEYTSQEIDRDLADPTNAAKVSRMLAEQLKIAGERFPHMLKGHVENMAQLMVRAEIRKHLPIVTFEEFCRVRELRQTTNEAARQGTLLPDLKSILNTLQLPAPHDKS